MMFISSSNNSLIKEVKSLKTKKNRQTKGLFFIEGVRIIEEALVSGAQIKNIIISVTTAIENDIKNGKYLRDRKRIKERKSIKDGKSIKDRKSIEDGKGIKDVKGIEIEKYSKSIKNNRMAAILSAADYQGHEIYVVPESLFREISDTDTPQGILAIVRINNYSLKDIICANSEYGVNSTNNSNNSDNIKSYSTKMQSNKYRQPDKYGKCFIILDEIKDPGNMGTIIRTADAAGFNGIIASRGCIDPYNPKVLRSTMGSIFHIPLHICDNLIEALMEVKANGIRIYASHMKGGKNYYEVDMIGNIAIIIGNEANGISSVSASIADELIKIPMPGRTESLNASVAAGLLMYEPLRQRTNQL